MWYLPFGMIAMVGVLIGLTTHGRPTEEPVDFARLGHISNHSRTWIPAEYKLLQLLGLGVSPSVILGASIVDSGCWPMEGSSGFFEVTFREEIRVSSVTINHNPLPTMSTAPRYVRFSVYYDGTYHPIGSLEFKAHLSSTHRFLAYHVGRRGSTRLRVAIDSNWGDPRFTCIYNVRVGGYYVDSISRSTS